MSSPPAPERHAAGRDAKARVQALSRPRSESRQRTALVAVRLLPAERDILAETARSRGITLSELIRASAMRAASAPATEAETGLPHGLAHWPPGRPPTLRSFIERLHAGGRVITGYRLASQPGLDRILLTLVCHAQLGRLWPVPPFLPSRRLGCSPASVPGASTVEAIVMGRREPRMT